MSELHKFIFEGLPVRGALVRLTDAWTEILARRQANSATGAWPPPVAELLGEMAAAGVLMQSNIKFNGALVLQIFGDGPVKVAVAEVQHDLGLRVTAKVLGDVQLTDRLPDLVNVHNKGRCAITLDPRDKLPGQQPYQGVVPLHGDHREKLGRLSDVLQHYMLQSEQLDTTLVLAADDKVAAGLLIQRLPLEGEGNLAGSLVPAANEDEIGLNEHYNRIATLAASLKRDELLELDRRHRPAPAVLGGAADALPDRRCRTLPAPAAASACANMIRGLGREEAEGIVEEQGGIEVGCDFCGQQYRFDAVDAAQLFTSPGDQPPVTSAVQ